MSRLRWPAVGLVTIAALGTGTAYAVTGDGSPASYRTVAARTGDVEQTLSTTGAVDAANRADLGFGTDGTVARLLVDVGDTVRSGQVIGTLDTTDLDAALTEAKAEYARAVAQLASDRQAQADAVAGNDTSPTTPTTPTTPAPPTTGGDDTSAATAKILKALENAQDAVVLAQSHASQAVTAAKQALADQQTACAADAGDPADEASTCDAALAAVQQAQDVVSQAQDELAKALGALASVLGQALGSVQGQAQPRTTATTPDTPSQDASTPSNGGGGEQTVTAARLASDQAAIEQAQASVVAARQDLAQATLRSTRSGRLVALDAAVGDQVSAGSVVATVIGGAAVTVTSTVSESQVDDVEVGQTVRVSVPGVAKRTTGKVTAIGLVADSSTGTTSYPVTVTVENPTIALPAGSRAALQIVLATAEDVVTVPTSAVTRTGTGTSATVRTWNGSKLTRKSVQVGAVGTKQVEITRGLSAGTRVVLADVDRAIEGAATEVNDRGNFPFPGGANFRPPAGGGPVTFSRGG